MPATNLAASEPNRSVADSMAKIRRVRTKACTRCEPTSDVLYRVRVEQDGIWLFVCPPCLRNVERTRTINTVEPGRARSDTDRITELFVSLLY